jgi:hypothetical protein
MFLDTDSCVMACYSATLSENVRPGLERAFSRAGLFEDPLAACEQSGLFKIEGVHDEAYFRSLKTYYLSAPVTILEGGKIEEAPLGAFPSVRVRSVPRCPQNFQSFQFLVFNGRFLGGTNSAFPRKSLAPWKTLPWSEASV